MHNRLYNKAFIQHWQIELNRLPLAIVAAQTQASEKKIEINGARTQLSTAEADTAPFNLVINAVTAQLIYLENIATIPKREREMGDNWISYNTLKPQVDDLASEIKDIDIEISKIKTLQNIKSAQSFVASQTPIITGLRSHLHTTNSKLTRKEDEHDILTHAIKDLTKKLELEELTNKEKQQDEKHPPVIVKRTTLVEQTMLAKLDLFNICIETLSKDITKTKDELKKLEPELETQEQLLICTNKELKIDAALRSSEQLSTELRTLTSQKATLTNQHAELDNSAKGFLSAVNRNRNEIERLKNQNAELIITAGDHSTNENKIELNRLLNEARQLRKPFADIEDANSKQLAKLNSELKTIENNIYYLQNQLTEFKNMSILFQLRDNPTTLKTKLVNRIELDLNKFVFDHPADQTENEQLRLSEIKKDILFILTQPLENSSAEEQPGSSEQKTEDDGFATHPDRTRLYKLSGMILSKEKLLSDEDKESPLAKTLRQIRQDFPLDSETDYQKLQCRLTTPFELQQEISATYKTAVDALTAAAENHRRDHSACITLASEANNLAKDIEANKYHEDFNSTYYTQLSLTARALLNDAGNQTTQNRLGDLIPLNPIGQVKTTKRIIGALELLLGAAATTAALFSSNSTKKVCFGGVGLSSITHGLWSLYSSRQTGSVKSSNNYLNAAKKVPASFRLWSVQPTQLPQPSAPPLSPRK